ncbi:contractile injection system tape measure protein [Tenacibaculum agarivorans]|uniref:contractile injection system tape measure protein n=1 Tax=Tenacibaculum agarivorans TaxID=1908389 RepID=UPI00094B80F4|nr:contractile injection system tape measure protein [Tenacibaculum agarivorans]
MKNDQTHIIKSQQYHIELDDASKSYAYQSRVSQLQEHTIQNILLSVMDTFHSPKYLDQYDEIVLDLGTISASNFDRELGYKIEEAFSNFLKKNIYSGTLLQGKRQFIHKTYADRFLFFLRNGYLQWDVPSSQNPIVLLSEALKEDREILITALKKEGKKESIRRRLISQLQDPPLEELVIAIKNEEGIFINQSRRTIVDYQKKHHLVETHQSYFRNAVWEIILAYIFTEVTGYTNQKSFLKYLVRKVAAKYNMSYTVLLRKIASGIQKKNISKGANFEKIIFQLQEELTFNDIVKTKPISNFFETFSYFLTYKSLPTDSDFTSLQHFKRELHTLLKENPSQFETIFFSFIQQDENNIEIFTQFFGKDILDFFIKKSTNTIIQNTVTFVAELDRISTNFSQPSNTLQQLIAKVNSIILQTFIAVKNKTVSAIQEFLNQTLQSFVFDATFIEILILYGQNPTLISNEIVLSFTQELTDHKPDKKQVNHNTNAINSKKYITKLYPYVKEKNNIAFEDFEKELYEQYYQIATYKVLTSFLETYAKNKSINSNVLLVWLQQRLDELQQKGENIYLIISELITIKNVLKLDKKASDILIVVQQSYSGKKTETENLIPKESSNANIQNDSIISEYAYKELILTIKQLVFNRSNKNLYQSIKDVLTVFAKKHQTSLKEIALKLIDKKSAFSVPQFIILALKTLTENQKKNTTEENITLQHALDTVEYFLLKGTLPWWNKKLNVKELQQNINQVLHFRPEKFTKWFVKSSSQKIVFEIFTDASFEMFVEHIYPSKSKKIIATKKIFELVLHKDIFGTRSISSTYNKTLNYILFIFLQKNQNVELHILVEFLIEQVSKTFNISTTDFYQLLYVRVVDQKTGSEINAQLKEILITQIPKPENQYSSQLSKLENINFWKSIQFDSKTDEIISIFKLIHEQQPSELYFHLKRRSFRELLTEQVTSQQQKLLLTSLFSVADQSKLTTIFEIFTNFKKHISVLKYQSLWKFFINKVLLKIALDETKNWSIEDWSLLIFTSLSSLNDTTLNLIGLVEKATLNNNTISEKITTELHLLLEKSTTIEKEENKDFRRLTSTKERSMEGAAYIENAGMIILGPYIPMLFSRMDLTENREFKNDVSKQKGMYALQYAVTGKTDPGEHLLLLNKIICGVDIYEPLGPEIPLTEEEQNLIDSMLQAVIQEWSTLGNTSVEGLRMSFLERPGSIIEEEKKFVLVVEQKSFDMLLDHIPWNIRQLKLNWMEKLLETIWRQ